VIKVKPIVKLQIKDELRYKLKRLVNYKYFDRIIFALLVVNTAILCLKWY